MGQVKDMPRGWVEFGYDLTEHLPHKQNSSEIIRKMREEAINELQGQNNINEKVVGQLKIKHSSVFNHLNHHKNMPIIPDGFDLEHPKDILPHIFHLYVDETVKPNGRNIKMPELSDELIKFHLQIAQGGKSALKYIYNVVPEFLPYFERNAAKRRQAEQARMAVFIQYMHATALVASYFHEEHPGSDSLFNRWEAVLMAIDAIKKIPILYEEFLNNTTDRENWCKSDNILASNFCTPEGEFFKPSTVYIPHTGITIPNSFHPHNPIISWNKV